MGNTKKKTKWIKRRHRIVRNILSVLLQPYVKIKYGMTVTKFRPKEKRPYLILYNHQTGFDQFFIGISFRDAVYYLATEDIFSIGFPSTLIRFLAAPIPIQKQTLDLRAVKTCLQVAREGGTIAIAPEGNRTYSGKTEYINPAIASLAKKIALPIVLFRIEGGYGTQPRWSDVIRKGKMRAYVSQLIEPEEYRSLLDEELIARIRDGLFVDEAQTDDDYRHPKRAEYIERLLYVCPYCGLSRFESHRERFACLRCGREVIYGRNKQLEGVGFELPFRFVGEWYDYQNDFVLQLDPAAYETTALSSDTVRFSEVIVGKRKKHLRKTAALSLYGNRIALDEGSEQALTLPFDAIHAMAVLGKNKLNVYIDGKTHQIKGDKRFNAVKYVNLYYRFQQVKKGENNGKFLGL